MLYHFYKKDKFRRINLFIQNLLIHIKTKLKIYILNYTVVNTTLWELYRVFFFFNFTS
jgi:hypothetical protein